MVVFEVINLSVKNKANNFIFDNFSFQIQDKEIWMVTGPNGVGKSSLYEAFIGLRNVEKGRILLNNKNITKMLPSQRVRLGLKYIAQQNALFESVSILENLEIISQSLVPRSERKYALEKAIEMFELQDFLKRTPLELSGGQKRRVELSKIVIGPAFLVLLDEPFAAIDSERIENLCDIFKILTKEGMSFFINDHSQKSLKKISDFCINLGPNLNIVNLNE